MDINGAALADKGVAPCSLKKLAAAQGLVTVGHKDGQQGKFPRRQAKLAAGAAHTVGAQVNGQVFVGNVRIIRGHDKGPPFR